ncbi:MULTISPECIES: succinyl-diaminopimelate desuccinylase [Corynebacterium]|uniref:Succinyl-diaminopimelate desuccinylase n=1 Tax=Corynebacterium amycolatum TaxID=43765 RepID=A0AAW9SUB4_CORAY|nr:MULTISPECIES: succinyl-diaminopimelate desuccinylase [Corynebacterium]MBC6761881.1 succinyl-diaminopimelate desuccinylase [Corynebacterium sp. LK27]MDK7110739.1 succinyl-diaminopimelate desuccinylase [Corynebacterium amycolatum]MDK7145936.1 succinyl-diaminopimelate desuccinylase [Corynebacterium amycolatum]MDK7238492.1 succinyl-diaminopimelate desuccinylase [Corynebacterium amycolatum]MDK7248512.1 succinyl-diaminopimelate desuccinylase [Corynebacterium amycolatum]
MKSKLNLLQDPVDLTAALVDIESVSHNETAIADAVEVALREVAQADKSIEVLRIDNNVIARTHRGLPQRVILAGHLDTVPTADNVPSTRGVDAQGRDTLFGCGTVDMKSGDAVYLHAFATLAASQELQRDLTLIMYECEEIAAEFNGLRHLSESHPELLTGDVALLGEPSGNVIEAGCQGSIRLRLTAHGTRAHSARAWLGDNAVHKLAPVLSRIAAYEPQTVDMDGLAYREGLNVVWLEAGVATNTLPDEAVLRVNFRFAPNRSADEAMAHFREVLGLDEFAPEDLTVDVEDVSPGALPGLHAAAAKELVAVAGDVVKPKFGWTDVARFSALGIPAVNFGPGDPAYCHKKDEQIPVECITALWEDVRRYLTTAPVAE